MNRPASWRSIMASMVDRRPFKVGGAMVDPVSRDASWRGGKERMQPQTLKVLMALISHRGEVVTRDELVQLCWDGRAVSDDVINRAILLLRHLAERAGGFEIETVPRTGYRLTEPAPAQPFKQRLWLIGGAALALAAIVPVGFFTYRYFSTPQQPTLTILVEPFAAETPDPASRRFASDARNSTVRMLSDSGLSVETSSGRQAPDLVINGTARVQAEGSIATVRIEDPARGAVIFARTLLAATADANNLPDRIGAALAAPLSWTAPLIRLDQRNPVDPAFTTQLFDGVTDADINLLRNYEFVRRNAPLAPNSAMAQLSLAMDTGFVIGALPRGDRPAALAIGRAAAEHALQLAPRFGDTAIPWCLLHSQVFIGECEDRLRAGIAADSDAPFVPTFLSDLLNNVGRIDESLNVASVSLAQDEYVPAKIGQFVMMLEAEGNHREAEGRYREGVRLWPDFYPLFWAREWGIIQSGDIETLDRFEHESHSIRFMGSHPYVAPLAKAFRLHSLGGVKSACPANADDVRAIECMMTLSQMGDVNDAFAIADRLYPARRAPTAAREEALWLGHPDSDNTPYLTMPTTAAMRRDPRFLPLADRLGLLDYWRTGRLPDFCTKSHEPVCTLIGDHRT